MIDFALADNLDIKMVDGEFLAQENGEATVINAFFTDSRVNKMRGYWLDITASEVWTYEQSRLTENIANELTETAKEIAQKLVSDGLYQRVDAVASISDGVMSLYLKCYDEKRIVVNRKFSI